MIRELKTLVAVSTSRTFAAAGSRIGLTQAAVSAQMQRLEASLGFALFDRTARSATLNAAGRQTVARAAELIRLADAIGSPDAGNAPAWLRIGAIASVQRTHLPAALAAFHRAHGGVRSRVVPGLSADLVDRVDAGDLDLAAVIRPPFPVHRDLAWTPLAREPFRLLVPEHLARRPWREALATQPFVRYDRASYGGRQVDRFLRDEGIAVRETCELDELDAIVRLVAAGLGVALVPQTSLRDGWPAGVHARALGDATFHREIGVVHRTRGVPLDATMRFVNLLVAAYAPTGAPKPRPKLAPGA